MIGLSVYLLLEILDDWGLRFIIYLDPQSMQNIGPYVFYYGFRAIILHTFGFR